MCLGVSDRIHGSTQIHHVCDLNLHFFDTDGICVAKNLLVLRVERP